MASTEVSSLLHGSGDTHGTSESGGVIAGFRPFHTQGNTSFTFPANTKNCIKHFIICCTEKFIY
jgi:hypothetical protein